MNILLRLVALTTIVWGCSVAAEAGTIGFRGPRPKAIIPWEYVFDVNGVEYEVESTARAYMAVYVTDDEPIEVRTHASGGGWQQTDVEELIGFHDGSRFKIVTYPSIRLFPRIYTQVYRWVGDSVGDNFGFNAVDRSFGSLGLEMTQPLITQNIEPLDPENLLVEGAYGPRWTGNATLFDEVVGGERFTVRLKEVGFGQWPTFTAFLRPIPEPSTFVLLGICAAMGLAARRRLNGGRGLSALS